MKKLLSAITLATLLLSSAGANENDIYLGEPGYGGSGCPAGTAMATLSPDKKALSIIFDEYFVEAGAVNRKRLARKNCSIAIPVHVPQGFSVSIIDVDYRGYVSLPRRAQARFSAEYFFAGIRGPRYTKTFRGQTDKDYVLRNQLGLQATVWSKCGADVNLRVNSSMMVRVASTRDDALATVDSADFRSGIKYKLQWKRCNGQAPADSFGHWN
ncbi:MAG: DUF4360 domain-containing protein [Bdellovibrionota bacterium]|nr:DUF4360 domain-containing protein [Bdellovibrionota bacterium]